MTQTEEIDWIGAMIEGDNLRLWLMDQASQLIDQRDIIVEGDPKLALQEALPDRDIPVLRAGWPDAPLRPTPCEAAVAASDGLIGGVFQKAPAGILRGEIVAVVGYVAAHPDFDGVICLIGNKSVWLHISAQEIVSFRAFLTPGLLQHLGADIDQSPLDTDALTAAVWQAMSRPSAIAADLASVQAQQELGLAEGGPLTARLHGLLIGAELAAAKPYWLGQNVVLIGTSELAAAYEKALRAQGIEPSDVAPDECVLNGFRYLRQLSENT